MAEKPTETITEEIKMFQEAVAKETQYILSLPEKDRHEYVCSVLLSVVQGLTPILKETNRIKQAKMAEKYFAELTQKTTIILPSFLYTIKDEFQPLYVSLLEKIAKPE